MEKICQGQRIRTNKRPSFCSVFVPVVLVAGVAWGPRNKQSLLLCSSSNSALSKVWIGWLKRLKLIEADTVCCLQTGWNLNTYSGDAQVNFLVSFWLLFSYGVRIISYPPLHMSDFSFRNDLGSASTCCAMDVECKGSELEPRCSSMFILIQRLVSLLKKRLPCLLVFYVMSFCRARILRDAHSHERHWIFAFLIFRLRLLRVTGSCSRYTFMLQEHKFLVIHLSCHRCDSCTYFC